MAITYVNDWKTFFLDGKDVTYAIHINKMNCAEHLYFGKKIAHEPLFFTRGNGVGGCIVTAPGCDDLRAAFNSYSTYPAEIAFFGTGDYREPCVEVLNPAGDRLVRLLYTGYDILPEKPAIPGMPSLTGGETLVLHLEDPDTKFGADLYYTVYDDCDVIARHIVYKNNSDGVIRLNRAYSFSLALPTQDYDVISFYGAWAVERTPERTPMRHGVVSVDSKRTSSSSTLNPMIAVIDSDGDEDRGEAWGFNLVYSSSFVLKAEGNVHGAANITGGINDFDFSWKLDAGDTFATPEAVIAYSAEGLGGMSRAFHDAYRNHLINPRFVKSPRPLLINNWEGTYFNFNNEKLMAIVDAVEGTGIDTFVLDDGWFGKRENEFSGLGDWFVNTKKLEGGLSRVIDHVHSKGMKFGLWFEPEMVSEDSDLFRAHPDYAIQVPGRERCHGRHQLVLDLTRAEVRDYIVNIVNKMLDENGIDYVKWDYNRNITESFSVGRDADRQAEFAHRYALGLYDLFERIIETHPNVFFEGCASGGARFDPAILHYFSQIWTSDNSDAESRTQIQYGTSFAYPLSAMSCHVSACPNHQTRRETPFATRANIAQLGATGYELDTTAFTDEDRKAVRAQTEEYRAIQDLILKGDLYRIDDPFTSNFFSEAVVSKDKNEAILTAYRRMGGADMDLKRIRMKGLDPEKTYFCKELGEAHTGNVFMRVGIPMHFPAGDFASLRLHFKVQ